MTDQSTISAGQSGLNILGLIALVVGVSGAVLSLVPGTGPSPVILAPIAIVLGGIALLREPRLMAIGGVVVGLLALAVWGLWPVAAQPETAGEPTASWTPFVSETPAATETPVATPTYPANGATPVPTDTPTPEASPTKPAAAPTVSANAPLVPATVRGLWVEYTDDRPATERKYGGKRIAFSDELIDDFNNYAATPVISFRGKDTQSAALSVAASFVPGDADRIKELRRGERISFACTQIREVLGEGYSLGGCVLR